MKKSILIFSIVFIAIAFAVISTLVYINKGANAKLIAKKIKIGALLISMTTVFSACPVVSCYDPVQPNQFYINLTEGLNENNQIDISANNIIRGELYYGESTLYSFALCKHDSISNQDSIDQIGYILPTDGSYDSSYEEFYLSLDTNTIAGIYNLFFYDLDTTQINQSNIQNWIRSMQIEIL